MTNWFKDNKRAIIRSAFLVPILSVAVISISHVVSWYDLANPIKWAIYLSVAVEIAAMAAIAAASVNVKGFSVWFVFGIVTFIQFIGNIFFCYSEIDVTSVMFTNWIDLTSPVIEMMGSDTSDPTVQRRWLALLEGGLLPMISLTCLHFFIQYEDVDVEPTKDVIKDVEPLDAPEPDEYFEGDVEEGDELDVLIAPGVIGSEEEFRETVVSPEGGIEPMDFPYDLSPKTEKDVPVEPSTSTIARLSFLKKAKTR